MSTGRFHLSKSQSKKYRSRFLKKFNRELKKKAKLRLQMRETQPNIYPEGSKRLGKFYKETADEFTVVQEDKFFGLLFNLVNWVKVQKTLKDPDDVINKCDILLGGTKSPKDLELEKINLNEFQI